MGGLGDEAQRAAAEDTERARKERLIALVDAAHPSPAARAQRVLDVIRTNTKLTNWDIACFCAEYLGMMSAAWPWLGEDSMRIARLIYTAHYEHFGTELPEEAKRTL